MSRNGADVLNGRRPDFPSGYSVREAAAAAGLTPQRVRSFVRSGLIRPRAAKHGAYRLSFQDLVVLRTARDLADRVPSRRLHRALARLREQLPSGRDLSALRIGVDGDDVVVQDGRSSWEPLSGQCLLNFDVAGFAAEVAPMVHRAASLACQDDRNMKAEDWFELACDLESCELESARDAYRRALELDPEHVDSHVNLGRILHEDGNLPAAEAHFRAAIRREPKDATALFNLGVCAEDQGKLDRAVRYYRRALESEPEMADANLNLALAYEKLGRPRLALRYLAVHRRIVRGRT